MNYIFFIVILFTSFVFNSRTCDNLNNNLINSISIVQRPNLDYHLLSPSGHFMIHYNNYYDGIDEYALNVALAADISRTIIVDTLNFIPEVPDDDGIYDIYIKQLQNGDYGKNNLEDSQLGTSYVEIDDDFIGSQYATQGEDAMKIAVAHEYFHAIQRAYMPQPLSNAFFYELSSIWIEDIIYPDINDYIDFGQNNDDYFNDPDQNINDYNGYGLGLYAHYLNFKYNSDIIRQIWDRLLSKRESCENITNVIDCDFSSDFDGIDNDDECQWVNSSCAINSNNSNLAINTIDNILKDYNSSFVQSWIDFNTRNLFNGMFTNMNNDIYYYEDQNKFNPIKTNPIDINQFLNPISNPDYWTDNYTYITDINNKSISIKSFDISQSSPQDFNFDIQNSSSYSSFALISSNNHIIDTFPTNDENQDINFDYILDNDDNFHFVYISKNESNQINTIISKKDYSYNIDCYPNPIHFNQSLTLKISSKIAFDNIKIDIFNIKGQLIKEFSIGNISYSSEDYNEISLYPFNDYIPSGVYILNFYLDDYTISKKIVYLK